MLACGGLVVGCGDFGIRSVNSVGEGFVVTVCFVA